MVFSFCQNSVFIGFLIITPFMRIPGLTKYLELFKIIMGLSLIGVWLFGKISRKSAETRLSKTENPFSLWIIIFLFWGLITSLASSNIKISMLALFLHCVYFAYLYAFCDFMKNKDCLEKIIKLLIVSGTFIALLGILQYLLVQFRFFEGLEKFIIPAKQRGFNPTVESEVYYRSCGTFAHPNLFGGYLSLVIPLAAWMSILQKNKKKRLLLLASLIIMIGGVIFSFSRGAILSILMSFSVAIFVFRRKIFKWHFLLAGIIFFTAIGFSDFTKDFLRFEEGTGREYLWAGAWQMIKERLFLGWGLGTFPANFFSRYGFLSIASLNNLASEMIYAGGGASFENLIMGLGAHNIFLNYSAEMGIGGGILIYLFYAIYFKEVASIANGLSDKRLKYILYALAAAVLGHMAHGFFESILMFGSISVSPIFILFVAMTIVIKKIALSQEDIY